MFNFLKKPKSNTSYTIVACKDCEHCNIIADEPRCNRPLGTFANDVDVYTGIVTVNEKVLRNRCTWERTHEHDDVDKNMICCGMDAKYFKAKKG